MGARAPRGFGQYSGTARALERVGERWSLLILRDLLQGARRYGDLKASLPRIPTNILSDRLRELQEAGLLRRVPVVRGGYELTPLGRALEPVIVELERWGWSSLREAGEGETMSGDALAHSLRAAFRADAAGSLPPTEYVLHVGGASVAAIVAGGALDVVPVGPGSVQAPANRRMGTPQPEAILELVLDPETLRDLLSGAIDPVADPAAVPVLAGRPEFVVRFCRTFRIEPVGPETSGAVAATQSVA
ncbi:transcriptional regulator [Agromyces protaetiae]|uniref:Transcriptional regulator n=1 Tax=Agromyces protaetiae TaxID=2509455 RepID=A0A4P6F9A3_9MICO|nr:helix-turn-helix domain-containing protein [Agromyces protaetiae]QAY72165.1 transcriptional regulator [Agromyces protaetiae]